MSSTISGAGTAGAYSNAYGTSSHVSPHQRMTNLFNEIDTSGSGSISKSDLAAAFKDKDVPGVFQKEGVDKVWSSLDPDNTGSVNKSEFVSGMKNLFSSLRRDGGQDSQSS